MTSLITFVAVNENGVVFLVQDHAQRSHTFFHRHVPKRFLVAFEAKLARANHVARQSHANERVQGMALGWHDPHSTR